MDNDARKELELIRQQLAGVTAAIDSSMGMVRKDIHYLGRAYLPMIGATMVSLVLSICALAIALENRSLILNVAAQTSKNARDLENILPIVLASPTQTK